VVTGANVPPSSRRTRRYSFAVGSGAAHSSVMLPPPSLGVSLALSGKAIAVEAAAKRQAKRKADANAATWHSSRNRATDIERSGKRISGQPRHWEPTRPRCHARRPARESAPPTSFGRRTRSTVGVGRRGCQAASTLFRGPRTRSSPRWRGARGCASRPQSRPRGRAPWPRSRARPARVAATRPCRDARNRAPGWRESGSRP
jgi:hypothetical protein